MLNIPVLGAAFTMLNIPVLEAAFAIVKKGALCSPGSDVCLRQVNKSRYLHNIKMTIEIIIVVDIFCNV